MHEANNYTSIPGLSINRAGGGDIELFSSAAYAAVGTGFTRLLHREAYGEMDFEYFLSKDFQIWRSRYRFERKMIFASEGDIPIFELHIPLSPEPLSWWDGQRQQTLRRLQFDLEYASFINSKTVFEATQICETLDVHYTTRFVSVFTDQYPVLQTFLDNVISKRRASLLNEAVRFLSPRMMNVVNNIIFFKGSAEDAEAYYAQQAAMLLEMVLERAMRMKHDYCQRKDIEAAVAVRKLIEENPQHSYTADELSIYTGINVSKLHKCFKELHGSTLFDFGQGVRLEHAKQLLLDTRLTLQEIAEQCGYGEHANFTAAFTKRFQVSPSQYRGAVANHIFLLRQ